jgi:hypothetical protein
VELVPFFDDWTGSETGLDLHAYYRRPGPGVNLTTAIPVRRHRDYAARGWSYVSLASAADINLAAAFLRARGIDPRSFAGSYRTDLGGAFDVALYAREAVAKEAEELVKLRAQIKKFGVEAVLELKRSDDPTYELPPEALEPATPAKKPQAAAAPQP